MRVSARSLWILYAGFIVYGSLIPFHFADTDFLARVRSLPVNPFISPETGHRISIPDAVQNVLFFLPFGALGALALHRRRVVARVGWITLLAAALSASLEAAQVFTTDRVTSLSDVVANALGAFLGAVGAISFQGIARAGLDRLRAEGMADTRDLRPLVVSTTVLLIAFWQPFDATLDVSTVAGKVHALESDIWQFTGLRDEGTSIILAVFFSTTLAGYLSSLGESRVGRKAAVIGALFVCALEATQFIIGSRAPGLWDAAIAILGVAIGAAIWTASSRIFWPRLWLFVTAFATLSAAALQMLSPFELSPVYRTFGWFPFFGYYSHTTFETLSHVIELLLLYFPLAYWLSASPGSRGRALGAALLLTLAIAGPIEYLQGWVVGRYPDISDIGVSLAGAFIGYWAARTRL